MLRIARAASELQASTAFMSSAADVEDRRSRMRGAGGCNRMLIAERTADLERRQSLVTLRDRINATLGPIVSGYSECALVGFPDSANVGTAPSGLASWRGFARWAFACVPLPRTRLRREHPRAELPDGLILLHGGGNLGDLWPRFQRLREQRDPGFPSPAHCPASSVDPLWRSEALARTRAVFDIIPI